MDRYTWSRKAICLLAGALAVLPMFWLPAARPASASRATEQGPPSGTGQDGSGVTAVPETVRVLMPDGSVRTMYMDDYLKGVVPAEVPASWPYDSLCAQAVAARCYAATADRHPDQGADVCTTTHCQVWKEARDPRTDLAVDSTHKVAVLYGGQVVSAFFFGHCDGHTRNSEDVWGSYLPYCRSVSCPCGNTTLWGHGVGMCQEGARTLAQAGWDYKDILKHYYTGTEVRSTEPEALGWYFAEGTTHSGFVTYFCIGNPSDSAAQVTVRYIIEGGGNKDVSYTVREHSRLTIDASSDVGAGRDFSCEVLSTNGVPVVAERPVYFNYKGSLTGGHDTLGSAYLRPTWYFAEGTTRPGFDTYLCIGNPSDTEAQVIVTYFMEGGGTADVEHRVGPRTRETVNVAEDIGTGKDFSCRADCPGGTGLVVERPMYFRYGTWTGGHDTLGSLSARPAWYFAEGSTRADFHTYLCIANPTGEAAELKVSYLVAGGGNVDASYNIGPLTRRTILASDDIGGGRDFSVRINSTNGVGVVAERPMYFNYSGTIDGGSDTMGTNFPRPSWYFAEGTARPGITTYLCVSNPTEKGAQLKITYLKGDGAIAEQGAFVEPLSRTTIRPADVLGTAADSAHDFAVEVESTNSVGVIAERPMYFDFRGWTGGHVSMGH
jgi:Stage II sporulation protein